MININQLIRYGKFFAKKFAELKFQLEFFYDEFQGPYSKRGLEQLLRHLLQASAWDLLKSPLKMLF